MGDVLDFRHTLTTPPNPRAAALPCRTADPTPANCCGHPCMPGPAEAAVAARRKRKARFAGGTAKPSASAVFPKE